MIASTTAMIATISREASRTWLICLKVSRTMLSRYGVGEGVIRSRSGLRVLSVFDVSHLQAVQLQLFLLGIRPIIDSAINPDRNITAASSTALIAMRFSSVTLDMRLGSPPSVGSSFNFCFHSTQSLRLVRDIFFVLSQDLPVFVGVLLHFLDPGNGNLNILLHRID